MSLKSAVRNLLVNYDRAELLSLLDQKQGVIARLNRLLFDGDELIQWRAAEALGWVAGKDPFALEKIIGRLLYTLNDDSGSIGWFTPQALGEIGANDPELVEDFFPAIISNISREVFRPGCLWAIGRMARIRPDLVEESGDLVKICLSDPDPRVRGLACWCFIPIDHAQAKEILQGLLQDKARFPFYENGELGLKVVGEMALIALNAQKEA
ncbi:MAG: hypothetical protein JRD68_14635 [Deltaproteobacteria bacterium]|nr:hypothetical protein [Deltaproteobacteria bacterium]